MHPEITKPVNVKAKRESVTSPRTGQCEHKQTKNKMLQSQFFQKDIVQIASSGNVLLAESFAKYAVFQTARGQVAAQTASPIGL